MPTDWKYPCSANVIDESSRSRSGDASSEFALGAPLHTCAQCPPPTIAIKTPALGRSVGYTCTVGLKFQVQGY